jgi:hypothetical protein
LVEDDHAAGIASLRQVGTEGHAAQADRQRAAPTCDASNALAARPGAGLENKMHFVAAVSLAQGRAIVSSRRETISPSWSIWRWAMLATNVS